MGTVVALCRLWRSRREMWSLRKALLSLMGWVIGARIEVSMSKGTHGHEGHHDIDSISSDSSDS